MLGFWFGCVGVGIGGIDGGWCMLGEGRGGKGIKVGKWREGRGGREGR